MPADAPDIAQCADLAIAAVYDEIATSETPDIAQAWADVLLTICRAEALGSPEINSTEGEDAPVYVIASEGHLD